MNQANALTKFHKEHQRFLRARIYLYRAHAHAKTGATEFGDHHKVFESVLAPEYENPHDYFVASLFTAYIANFELLLQELAKFVIKRHPKKVGKTTFTLAEVIDATGADGLIQRAIEEHLNKLMYKKPLEYLEGYAELLSINPVTLQEQWRTFIEAKARRDLGVHNGWKCNSVYQKKLAEAEIKAETQVGENLIPMGDYLDKTIDAIFHLAEKIALAVKVQHPTPAP